MKKFFLFAIVLSTLGLFTTQHVCSASELPQISAHAAVLMSDDDKSVIFEKNADEHLAMASTTKIMTSLLAIEAMKNDNRLVTITSDMVNIEGSSMGLKEGDIVNIDTLIKGMLMVSGNDAANSVAIAVGGNVTDFVGMMNEYARNIGMNDTNFVTPSGLDDEAHYSTAYDMALLGSFAMENDIFSEIVSKKSATVDFIEPRQRRAYQNHNRLITMYSGCMGIKTGFTKKAGRCLVSNAIRNGRSFTAVTLNAPDDWNDHIKMFDFGFENTVTYKYFEQYNQPVVGSNVDEVVVCPDDEVNITLTKSNVDKLEVDVSLPSFLYAPVNIGDKVGNVKFILDGKVIKEVRLIAKSEAQAEHKNFFSLIFDKITHFFR